jgi:4-hydroxybenzoyl-CoA thioesterase
VGFPVLNTRGRFMKPTRFGDDVIVESSITFGTSSFEVNHRLSLNGEVVVEGEEKRVWVVRDESGALKSQAIPAEVRAKFRA